MEKETLKEQLLEATLMDIKNIIKKYPNDMDLGKQIRNYFFNLPEAIKDFKEKIDKI